MTYLEIQNAVLGDRFQEAQRADCKNWINFRYWWLWTLHDNWTFAKNELTFTFTAGSRGLTALPADMRKPVAIMDADGNQLVYREWRELEREYPTITNETGTPYYWTRFANTILVAPTPSSTTFGIMLYVREFTPLTADTDVPALPAGAHFALVQGALAEGLKLQNDPTWDSYEQSFGTSVMALEQGYRGDQADEIRNWGEPRDRSFSTWGH